MTELNGMVSTGQPAGYGALDGQVLNPYDMRATVNGSSAGAVAAAASGLAAATVGVETDATTNGTTNPTNGNSISALVPAVAPASWRCGRRSASSRAPASCRSLAARTRRRPSAARSATSRRAPGLVGRDPATRRPRARRRPRRTTRPALSKSALAGKRIGVIAPTSGNAVPAFTDAVAEITGAGATAVA